MSKHLTLSHLQTIIPPLRHLIDTKAEAVDWNENDSDAKGFIRNRPFYEGKGTQILLEEDFTPSDQPFVLLNMIPLTLGQEYCVIFNGVKYQVVARELESGVVFLGNQIIAGSLTDEPFIVISVFADNISQIAAVDLETSSPSMEPFSITISTTETIIKKIDPKFLPELQGSQIGKAGDAEGAEIFNDYSSNEATGEFSHVEGSDCSVSGNCAHVEGAHNSAEGFCAHVEGSNNGASGDSAHVEGNRNSAAGACSHVEGEDSTTYGYSSHASGIGLQAYRKNTFVIGAYNYSPEQYGSGDVEQEEIIEVTANANCQLITTATLVKQENPYWSITSTNTTISSLKVEDNFKFNDGSRYYYYTLLQKINDTSFKVIKHTATNFDKTYGDNIFIVGNGRLSWDALGRPLYNRSNAHTLNWDGTAWYANDVYVGGTGQFDEAAEKLLKQSDLEAIAATDDEIIEVMASLDMLSVVTDTEGAILTDENSNILLV